MIRHPLSPAIRICVFGVVVGFACLAATACSGGDGNASNAPTVSGGSLVSVNFVGIQVAPGAPVPELFRNHVLTFRFSGPVDVSFGGLVSDSAGRPIPFTRLTSDPNQSLTYHAFADQVAAREALQVRANQAGASLLLSYVVGVHADEPETLVVDPRVDSQNPFGLPTSIGFDAHFAGTYFLPENSQITIGGVSVEAAGAAPTTLPIEIPAFSFTPEFSRLFAVGSAFLPDPVPAEVVAISAQSGATGSASDPISATESLEIEFSKLIDAASIDLARNLRVLNTSVLVAGTPAIVPGSFEVLIRENRTVVVFTPFPSFGAGPYDIEVRVGDTADPTLPPLLGVPNGAPPIQLEVANTMTRVFRTAACPGCPASGAIVESFAAATMRDASAEPVMGPAEWGETPGVLAGRPLFGDPLAGFPSNVSTNLGSRSQFEYLPPAFFPAEGVRPSPFDDRFGNNLGAAVNEDGGARVMHLYERADIGAINSSLELVEWGPLDDLVLAPASGPNDYPRYRAWCGQTSVTGSSLGGGPGLFVNYSPNYNLPNLQEVDPLGTGGVLVNTELTYSIPSTTMRNFYPFPIFETPFDFQGGEPDTSLVFEQDIAPGNQIANFNRFRSIALFTNASFTIRRLAGPSYPSSVGAAPAVGGAAAYNMRFTFVDLQSEAQSLFYDAGVTSPDFTNIALIPSPLAQPVGTEAVWEFQGVNAIEPVSGGTEPWVTYFSGSPSSGMFSNEALNQLDGKRFVRFRVTLRGNNITNQIQQYSGVQLSFGF